MGERFLIRTSGVTGSGGAIDGNDAATAYCSSGDRIMCECQLDVHEDK